MKNRGKKHILQKTAVKQCLAMFYQYASAAKHCGVKEEKINKCEQCGKIIRDARNLKRHMHAYS